MNFIFEQIPVGGDRNFGYLIGDRKSGVGALVDPSYQPELLIERATAQELKIAYILNTHGHQDHTNGNAKAQDLTGGQLLYHPQGPAGDLPLADGQMLLLGDLELKILFVPGHSADHIVIYEPTYHIALTGDHLFVGKIGGTGDEAAARQQHASLWRLYDELPLETTVWPGHDYGCRPTSTLRLEQATNPFLLAKAFDDFANLKANWSTFKAEHGLR